jgi:DNA-binding NarL/FixJ family response regulator
MLTTGPQADLDVLLQRSRPVVLVLDKSLRILCAEPGGVRLLAEACGEQVSSENEIPPSLAAALANLRSNDQTASVTITTATDLVVHLRMLRGRDEFYIVSIEHFARRDHLKQSTRRFALSKREREVLSLILLGNRASDIASELGISRATVSDHFTSLLRKTGSRNRSEMLAKLMDS